jgi:hypothetical protein
MIIGINGKIGSGKDTVGKIIQYLVVKKRYTELITDDFKEFHEEYKNSDKPLIYSDNGGAAYSDFEIKKFAGKLKQTASLLTGIPVEKFEDQEFKKTSLGSEWNRLLYATLDDENPLLSVMSVRELLQKLGTEAMRDGLHENTWVNALFADYNATGYNYTGCENKVIQGEWEYPNWIITDMRFPNEMEAVEEKSGITIRVVRYPKTVEVSRGPQDIETIPFDPTNQKHMSLWKGDSSRLHASETALDNTEFDYEIINDGTIEDLVEKVREILIKEEII